VFPRISFFFRDDFQGLTKENHEQIVSTFE